MTISKPKLTKVPFYKGKLSKITEFTNAILQIDHQRKKAHKIGK